ncbi:antitoxin MazE family protein [Alsobacter sp. KACC 23698]|uniref:Antitoxin MazE family protein n=1 Tax=Alsobacter sp. KACC 23698 TaxID=3149229 RepID=A0AAU7JBI2_9HYPH
MATTAKREGNRQRVKSFRERQKAEGLRLVQVWMPDVRSAEFKAEAHRQSALVATSAHARDDQDFVDAVSEFKA